MLQKNTPAPHFTLPDKNAENHALLDYKGKYLLIYFYPKDDTPGCTKEACGIRDAFAQFKENNIVVLGISADSPKKHAKFSEKYNLPFTLLSDEEKFVIKSYEAWGEKKFMGKTYQGILRISYLINPEGIIVKTYPNVKPAEHAEEVLEDVKRVASNA